MRHDGTPGRRTAGLAQPTQVQKFVRGLMFTPQSDSAVVSRVASAMAAGRPDILVPAMTYLQSWARDRSPAALASLWTPLGAPQASTAGHEGLEAHRAHLPALEVDTMPATGHFPMLENPAEFNARLDSLLLRLRAPPSD
jgi:pimeloyl-ACP methyl ester carboxylesterase